MELEEVTDWLWCLRTPVVQAYAVRHGNGFDLIDTSTAGQDGAILDALASVTGSTADDVADHTGSAAALAQRTGARILGPTADAPVIEWVQAAPVPNLRDWEAPLYEQSLRQVPPAPPVSIGVRIDDGATVDWERSARSIATPRHTPGSVAVLFDDAGVLVAGDAIASHDNAPMVGVFNADVSQAVATFPRLATLDVEIACFGHGAPLVGNAGARLRQAAAAL